MQAQTEQPQPDSLENGGRNSVEAAEAAAEAIDKRERTIVLWLANINHLTNHFQNQMLNPMYPALMPTLGFGPIQIGLLTGIRTMLNSWTQLGYGFLTPFIHRIHLLGVGAIIMAIGTFSTGFATNFTTLVIARCVAATGGSSQHPVGASLLSSYFPKSRGQVLALNTSISQIGTMLAPVVSIFLLQLVGWRATFMLVSILSVMMAITYFFFKDKVRDQKTGSNRAKLAASKISYLRVLKNRNMLLIAMVFMIGGAGRGDVTPVYLPLHLVNDFGFPLWYGAAALFLFNLSGMGGPIFFGWLSDRLNRVKILQASLFLSGIATLWLAFQGPSLPMLISSVLFYGAVTHSRGTLTQALIADTVQEEDRDAAFSMYFFLGFFASPVWAILTGFLYENFDFSTAFGVMAISYVGAMAVMTLVKDPRSQLMASQIRSGRGGGGGGE